MKNKRLILFCSVAFLFIITPIIYFGLKYNGTNKTLTPQQAIEEYKKEAASIKLAPGWQWPDKPPIPSEESDGSKIGFGKGHGKIRADMYWFCSWVDRSIDSKLNESEHQEALENAFTVHSKYFYTSSLTPDSKLGSDQMLQNAKHGNMDEMKQYFELNCKGQ
ncbi:hypothetical protein AN964_12110 [Heyndrickxia shackletonii]|uniref:Uncharacterized protein n=1 Tax=Heyndrickxia shackletonii TaxID=157838 RepID=A0A0Q3TJM1_9BACI|nr:hypothetical protein [Heyndrickxia shackletonii]KQL54166.1 hypothetical protein AN964_12110 [Heyndrickxia shackletonii]NEY99271.1 hypothetical protein [Heyndrickxia shackletonii]